MVEALDRTHQQPDYTSNFVDETLPAPLFIGKYRHVSAAAAGSVKV
jgi:hypothetical protein